MYRFRLECFGNKSFTKSMRLCFERFGFVVLLDATYGKNDRLMPLQTFIGRSSENCILPFAVGSTRSEVKEEYLWLIERFHQCYGRLAPTWITDGDAKIYDSISAIADIHKVHVFLLLCVWHLLENIKRHLVQTKIDFDPIVNNLSF